MKLKNVMQEEKQYSLFGEEILNDMVKSTLCERYLIPPFSIFDTKQAYWLDRKRVWNSIGIKSELGRDDGLCFNLHSFNYESDKKIRNNEIDETTKQNSVDLVFTCPPYFDLEVYSDKENDLSNMSYEDFKSSYADILQKSAKVLKDNRFFVIVVGDVRNDKTGEYIGLVNLTKQILKECGLKEWNEIILLNSIGTASLRAGKQFNATRKLVKIHQNVLVFYKGEQDKIKTIFSSDIVDDIY